MPKKPTKKSISDAADTSAETSTVSTRFTPAQRKAIEDAANILNCSPAQFLRDAVLMRAVDVMNSHGRRAHPLRKLADKTLIPLINPAYDIYGVGNNDAEERKVLIDRVSMDQYRNHEHYPEVENLMQYVRHCFHDVKYEPVTLDALEADQLRSVIRTCPVSFSTMLLEAWDATAINDHVYSPAITLDELLKEGDSK